MTRRPIIATLAFAFVCCFGFACNDAPGRPRQSSIPVDPANVSDFATLFGSNCSGCHGDQGKGGPAIPITDPVYLAIADDSVIRKAATNGIAGTSMPAFATSAGGMLTDKQIDIIVAGIREHYAKPDVLAGSSAPPYTAATPGNATHGAATYSAYCSSCHGDAGRGGPKASSIVDGSFLALLTDQALSHARYRRAARLLARPIGATTSQESRCPRRKFPMSSPGCLLSGQNCPAVLIRTPLNPRETRNDRTQQLLAACAADEGRHCLQRNRRRIPGDPDRPLPSVTGGAFPSRKIRGLACARRGRPISLRRDAVCKLPQSRRAPNRRQNIR